MNRFRGGAPRPPTIGFPVAPVRGRPPHRHPRRGARGGGRTAALARNQAGEGDDDDFALLDDDWSVTERTIAQLGELGLPTDLDRTVAALSGGERTLAALAGRLLGHPRVLLLDEPTNNLDTRARGRLFGALERFVSGGDRIALVVSHDLEL